MNHLNSFLKTICQFQMDYSWIEKWRNIVVEKKGWIFVGIMEERGRALYEKQIVNTRHNSGRPFHVGADPF